MIKKKNKQTANCNQGACELDDEYSCADGCELFQCRDRKRDFDDICAPAGSNQVDVCGANNDIDLPDCVGGNYQQGQDRKYFFYFISCF